MTAVENTLRLRLDEAQLVAITVQRLVRRRSYSDRIEIGHSSVGWAKAPTGPREARPDDRLRAVPTSASTKSWIQHVGTLRFAHPSVTGLDWSTPLRHPLARSRFCTGSARGRRLMGSERIGRPIYERVVAVPTGWAAVWPDPSSRRGDFASRRPGVVTRPKTGALLLVKPLPQRR
jgi:hypothetical protein